MPWWVVARPWFSRGYIPSRESTEQEIIFRRIQRVLPWQKLVWPEFRRENIRIKSDDSRIIIVAKERTKDSIKKIIIIFNPYILLISSFLTLSLSLENKNKIKDIL